MENALPRDLLDDAMPLGEGEKGALARALKGMIASGLATSAGPAVTTTCPHCGGGHFAARPGEQ